MRKVFVLAPSEDWIVDRFVKEWRADNPDISTLDPEQADVIWLMADWCRTQLPRNVLYGRKVLCTVHHVVPQKFGMRERMEFEFRDRYITAYRDRCKHLFPLEVVLAGWRRQYLMARLDEAGIGYHYFEKPPQEVVNDLYQCLNLYPITARQEGGPQSLIECGLLGVPAVSRDIGMASQVLPASAISDDVTSATPTVPDVSALSLPNGYAAYRKLLEIL